MSLLLPDVEIVNALNTVLNVLREDYKQLESVRKQNRSLLYLMFGNVTLGEYDFFQNVKELILTTPESPRHIEAKLSLDHNTQQITPSIWVGLPSENNRNNSLGVGEGIATELLFNNYPDQDEYKELLTYRWGTTYQIIIGTINRNETLILYHLIKAMIVACITHLEHQGLSNMKIGGGDLKMMSMQDRLFTKAVTLNFEYEQNIPSIFNGAVFRKLKLYWKPEGAEIAAGPIEVEVDDNITSSSAS